jgi:hypothetical protein
MPLAAFVACAAALALICLLLWLDYRRVEDVDVLPGVPNQIFLKGLRLTLGGRGPIRMNFGSRISNQQRRHPLGRQLV